MNGSFIRKDRVLVLARTKALIFSKKRVKLSTWYEGTKALAALIIKCKMEMTMGRARAEWFICAAS